MKKALFVMPLMVASFLMSCGSNNRNKFSLDLENATKWVEEHYTKEGDIFPKSGEIVVDYSETTGEEMKNYVRNQFKDIAQLDENLRGRGPIKKPSSFYYLNEKKFKAQFTKEYVEKYRVTFDVNNDQLTITIKTPKDESIITGEMEISVENDKIGRLISQTFKYVDFKMTGIDGVRTGYDKATVVY